MSSSRASAPPQHVSLLAGMAAGGIEGFVTYPAEFAKTRAQFVASGASGTGRRDGPIAIVRHTLKTNGIRGLYSGCGALVVGNALKAGVRFWSYDRLKDALRDDQGKITPGRTVLAGLGAGCFESVFAVTPSEAIKTKLIDDAKRTVPEFRSMLDGTVAICRQEGVAGLYRGLFATTMKQGANSAVRFSSYSGLKSWLEGLHPQTALSSVETFAVGGAAGLITVYTTMPLDNIKTRMQSLNASTEYRNSFHCASRMLRDEGIAVFWRGTTPRLTRLIMSGGIVFTVYENLIAVLV